MSRQVLIVGVGPVGMALTHLPNAADMADVREDRRIRVSEKIRPCNASRSGTDAVPALDR